MSERIGVGDAYHPLARRPAYRVSVIRPGREYRGLMLSDTWHGLSCHWTPARDDRKARTRICRYPELCDGCERGIRTQWHALIAWQPDDSRVVEALMLSRSGFDALKLLCPLPAPIRGTRIIVRRANLHPSSRLVLYGATRTDKAYIPQEPDLLHTIAALYPEDFAAWSKRCQLPPAGGEA